MPADYSGGLGLADQPAEQIWQSMQIPRGLWVQIPIGGQEFYDGVDRQASADLGIARPDVHNFQEYFANGTRIESPFCICPG